MPIKLVLVRSQGAEIWGIGTAYHKEKSEEGLGVFPWGPEIVARP